MVLAFTSQVHTKKGVPTRNNSVQFVIIIFPGQNLRQFVVPRMRRKSSPTDLDLYRYDIPLLWVRRVPHNRHDCAVYYPHIYLVKVRTSMLQLEYDVDGIWSGQGDGEDGALGGEGAVGMDGRLHCRHFRVDLHRPASSMYRRYAPTPVPTSLAAMMALAAMMGLLACAAAAAVPPLRPLSLSSQLRHSGSAPPSRPQLYPVYWNVGAEGGPHSQPVDVTAYGLLPLNWTQTGGGCVLAGCKPWSQGAFPTINPTTGATFNGGVPQAGNLSLHLARIREQLPLWIPDPDWGGNAVGWCSCRWLLGVG